MAFDANLELVQVYMDSTTKDGIIKLQYLNNVLNRKKYNYTTPMKDGKTWIVWFFADIGDWTDPRGMSEEEIQTVKGFKL